MGYTRRERLRRIEFPLAVPLIIAGVRLAIVTLIGLATVASILGDSFGGFGQFITEGLQTVLPDAIPTSARCSRSPLAFAADFLFIWIERRLTPWAHARAETRLMPDVLGFFADPANWAGPTRHPQRMVEHLWLSGWRSRRRRRSGFRSGCTSAIPAGARASRSTSPTSAARSRPTRSWSPSCRSP